MRSPKELAPLTQSFPGRSVFEAEDQSKPIALAWINNP